MSSFITIPYKMWKKFAAQNYQNICEQANSQWWTDSSEWLLYTVLPSKLHSQGFNNHIMSGKPYFEKSLYITANGIEVLILPGVKEHQISNLMTLSDEIISNPPLYNAGSIFLHFPRCPSFPIICIAWHVTRNERLTESAMNGFRRH